MEYRLKLVGDEPYIRKPYGVYVFAYEKPDGSGFVEGKRGVVMGFTYTYMVERKVGLCEHRWPDQPIGSIAAHAPHLFDHEPTHEFTPEELERIANLPIGKPQLRVAPKR